MADTMAFALVGSLLCSLTLLPVLCAYLPAQAREGAERAGLRARAARRTTGSCTSACDHRAATLAVCLAIFGALAAAGAVHRRRVHAAPRRRRAVGARDDAVHDLVRRGVEARAAGAHHPARASRRSRPSPTSSAGPTTAPIRSGSSTTNTSSASSRTTIRPGRGSIHTKPRADRRDPEEAARRFPASSSTTRSRPKTRWTKRRRASRARSP